MKHLYLIRHAKSSGPGGGSGDHERPLDPLGLKQLGPISKAIRDEGALEGAVYCSSAVRARQTLEGLIPAGIHPAILIEGTLYTFDYKVLIDWLRGRKDEGPVTIVGHNPALEELAGYLLGASPGSVPTGGFMHISLSIEHWSELAGNTGRLEKFLTPQDVSYEYFKHKRRERDADDGPALTPDIPGALQHLYQDMRDLETGVIQGYDTAFLHQYRIAIRRSRAIAETLCILCNDPGLRQALKTLRKHALASSCLRDIHVVLARLEQGLPAAETRAAMVAAGLGNHLATLQQAEHLRLVKHITGGKYRKDMDGWHTLIRSRTFREMTRSLTAETIRQALDTHLKKYSVLARGLSRQSPDDAVHTIRKLLKRIRYLAEMEKSTYRDMLKQLTRYQKLFGGFQDLHVMCSMLIAFRDGIATASGMTDPLAVLDNLIAGLTAEKQSVLDEILTLRAIRLGRENNRD